MVFNGKRTRSNLPDNATLGILVDGGDVDDVSGSAGVTQGTHGCLQMNGRRRDGEKHRRLGITTQRFLVQFNKDESQHVLTIFVDGAIITLNKQ